MKLVFLTNFLTHHQTPFCDLMYKELGENFHLIAMRSADSEQKKLGYKELNDLYPYVIKAYEGEDDKALALCDAADVVISGSAPRKYIEKRLKENKLTFIYCERFFKKGLKQILRPSTLFYMFKTFTMNRRKKQFFLCAGAYVAKDINPFVRTPKKFFKWGYFPEIREYNDANELINSKEKNSIIWVARYIDWKHPEIAIEIGKRLLNDGYDFKINMIGNGVMLDDMRRVVESEGLSKNIRILGAVDSDKVRGYMEKSEIHIFTSDRQEGWGAVLNESMNSACAVVANKDIGAVPFLIKDGENGFIYHDTDELYNKVKLLLGDAKMRKEVSKNAYKTIAFEWNAKIATERFLKLCSALLSGGKTEWTKGPCSNSFVKE